MHWRLLTLVVICGSCIGGCGENPPQKPAEPNRDNERQAYFAAETQARKDRLKPLIEALDAFSIERHQPPDSLDELISGNYVEEIPNLRVTADHNATNFSAKANFCKAPRHQSRLCSRPSNITATRTIQCRGKMLIVEVSRCRVWSACLGISRKRTVQ